MVLLNGPVQNALFCVLDRYRNICVLLWQGTACSARLELTLANVGPTGYHCKEMPVPRVGTHAGQPRNHIGSHCTEFLVP